MLEGAPPLHALLLKAWLPLFSDPALGIRAFSAVCGAASLFVFAAVARRLAPERWRGAVLLAGLSSFWLHFAQDGRVYGLYLLVGLVELWLLLRLRERFDRGRAAAWALSAAAGLYTHNFFHLHLAAQAAALAGEGWRRRLAVFVLPYAAFLPWAASLARQVGAWTRVSVLERPMGPVELLGVAGTMAADTGFLALAHPGLTAALGAAVVAWLSWRRGERFLLVQLALPVALLVLAERLSGRAATQARYLILLSPLLYVLLSRAWAPVFAVGLAAYLWSGLYVDPRLERLSAALGAGPEPVVHLDAAYYTPLRCYYRPDRRHLLVDGQGKLNWAALPGERAVLEPGELERLGEVLVVDPQRRFFTGRLGRSSGADLARALGR